MANKIHPLQVIDIEDTVEKGDKGAPLETSIPHAVNKALDNGSNSRELYYHAKSGKQ